MKINIARVMQYKDELIRLRRDFHMHPELGFEEKRTSKIVEEYLKELGINTMRLAGTGIVGDIKNGGAKTIAIRADMDALPLQEENKVSYASKTPGIMHACGHDAHTAMLLITAKILSELEFEGNIRLIFQPAEEGLNGAGKMVQEGAIDGVDAILGLHVWIDLPAKSMGIEAGPIMAAVDKFKISLTGVGGHGASPHETRDPIVCSAELISALQSIVSRNIDPMKSAVLTVGKIHGGTAFNIIPERVELEGTVRTFEEDIHALVKERVFSITHGIAGAYGCKDSIDYQTLNYATVNDSNLAKLALKTAKALNISVVEEQKNMGGEDFSEYAMRIPGLFAFLGIRNEENGIVHPHHSPKFDMDESALPYGVAFEVNAALEFLNSL